MAGDLRAQLDAVQQEMQSRPPKLVEHTRRVVAEAIDLGAHWGVDPLRIELAGWGHDLFRHEPPERQLELARDAGVRVGPADRPNPVVLHGRIAAAVLRDRFRISDTEILSAVRDHTLGIAHMSLIAKVILLADKVEPNKRRRDSALRLMRKAARYDLDAALLSWSDWKWIDEREHDWQSHPAHWAARRAWVIEHHFDIDPLDRRVLGEG